MKLVSDWKDAWRWYSTQAMAVAAAIPFAWEQMPPDLKARVPETWVDWIISMVLIGGIVGRVMDQGA